MRTEFFTEVEDNSSLFFPLFFYRMGFAFAEHLKTQRSLPRPMIGLGWQGHHLAPPYIQAFYLGAVVGGARVSIVENADNEAAYWAMAEGKASGCHGMVYLPAPGVLKKGSGIQSLYFFTPDGPYKDLPTLRRLGKNMPKSLLELWENWQRIEAFHTTEESCMFLRLSEISGHDPHPLLGIFPDLKRLSLFFDALQTPLEDRPISFHTPRKSSPDLGTFHKDYLEALKEEFQLLQIPNARPKTTLVVYPEGGTSPMSLAFKEQLASWGVTVLYTHSWSEFCGTLRSQGDLGALFRWHQGCLFYDHRSKVIPFSLINTCILHSFLDRGIWGPFLLDPLQNQLPQALLAKYPKSTYSLAYRQSFSTLMERGGFLYGGSLKEGFFFKTLKGYSCHILPTLIVLCRCLAQKDKLPLDVLKEYQSLGPWQPPFLMRYSRPEVVLQKMRQHHKSDLVPALDDEDSCLFQWDHGWAHLTLMGGPYLRIGLEGQEGSSCLSLYQKRQEILKEIESLSPFLPKGLSP